MFEELIPQPNAKGLIGSLVGQRDTNVPEMLEVAAGNGELQVVHFVRR